MKQCQFHVQCVQIIYIFSTFIFLFEWNSIVIIIVSKNLVLRVQTEL